MWYGQKEEERAPWSTPLIFPGKVSHTRLFPRTHSFNYSYLMVGIPVGWAGTHGSILSVDVPQWWKRGWLRVESQDHLGRSNTANGLRAKLSSYLESQGVNPADYPQVYLVTSPRFLGYKFSPASFWYLYSAKNELEAMIAEVNNTFDERRAYLLRCNHSAAIESSKPQGISKFQHCWPKDFHVSPFNSRKGSYTLKATDILEALDKSIQAVHVTATLCSSKKRPKMVARLWSTSSPLDPASMTLVAKALFICSWWWVGLLTFPRIVFEAIRLAHIRGLSIWYRPEIQPTNIARRYTTEEIKLEHFFRKFLQNKVANSKTVMALRYIAPEQPDEHFRRSEILGSHLTVHNSTVQIVLPEFQILSPAYYSRFIHYSDSRLALAQEVQPESTANRTATFSGEDLNILFADEITPIPVVRKGDGILLKFLWKLIWRLRLDASPATYPYPAIPHLRMGSAPGPVQQTIQQTKQSRLPSALDQFVMTTCPRHEQRAYCHAAILIFSSERFALGSIALLHIYGIALVLVAILLYQVTSNLIAIVS